MPLRVAFLIALLLPSVGRAEPPPRRDKVDQVIDRALEFLQRTQENDGAWRGGRYGKNAAVTGLAVMAFLSAGHVPGEGPYRDTVEKGLRWVLQAQLPNGLIATSESHEMYHHGICTLLLAETVGMTTGKLAEEVRRKLEKAVAVILKAQRQSGPHRGGWRYRAVGVDGDISVTGWQLLALRAAKNLGCDVPAESIDRAVEYLLNCRDPSTGGFRYFPGSGVTIPCTGTCILGLELCGKDRHHSPEALKAGAFLLRNPPHWTQPHFFYSIYYCSQATFQLGDNYWKHYRPQLHDLLLRNQTDAGSWLGGEEGRSHGANYCTAMAVLALTVEYRFLPIYQRGEEAPEK